MGFVVKIELGFGQNLGWEMGFGTPLQDPLTTIEITYTTYDTIAYTTTYNAFTLTGYTCRLLTNTTRNYLRHLQMGFLHPTN